LGDGCLRRLPSAAQEDHRNQDRESEDDDENKPGDEPPSLDDRAVGLGSVELPVLRRGAAGRWLAGREVVRGRRESLVRRDRAPSLRALRMVLGPVLVRDLAEPVVDRLTGLDPDTARRGALGRPSTCLVHVTNARRLPGEDVGIGGGARPSPTRACVAAR
jgi:hypothetical protein